MGPITVEVREPLRTLVVRVDAPDHGLRPTSHFARRTVAVEEPRFHAAGPRVVMDYTRLAQWGVWEGWLEIDGERIDVDQRRDMGLP